MRTWLGSSGSLRVLAEHSQRLQQLTALLRAALPAPLNAHCRAGDLRDKLLILHADSSAWCELLRYQVPHLLAALRELPECRGLREIRIKTIPAQAGLGTDRPPPRRRLSAEAARSLRQAAAAVEAPALRAALLRLSGETR